MHPLTSEVLSRFHQALVAEIREQHPEYLEGRFTVAEIYQNLVPYRTHRDRIGVEMNGDYEDALLRLLAGEGDYLVLESEHARKELREELESSNPNTGLFREYAAADVRLNPDRVPAASGKAGVDGDAGFGPPFSGRAPAGQGASAVPVENLAPDEGDAEEPATPAAPVADADEPEAWFEGSGTRSSGDAPGAGSVEPTAAPTGATTPDACRWCGEGLPRRDTLNYCPFCGANVHLVPCSNCGEELEPTWRFCVACGTAAPDDEGG